MNSVSPKSSAVKEAKDSNEARRAMRTGHFGPANDEADTSPDASGICKQDCAKLPKEVQVFPLPTGYLGNINQFKSCQ